MAANLPRLKPDSHEQVEVQDTSFTRDTLGRYICNTLPEATTNPAFDVVVIGAGTYGAHCAQYIFQKTPHLRVLVLEAGSFLLPGHLQTLPRLDLFTSPVARKQAAPGVSHSLVWSHTYTGSDPHYGLPLCVGGRSLYWAGWAARLTEADLKEWPQPVREDLKAAYPRMERLVGRSSPASFLEGPFADTLAGRIRSVRENTRLLEVEQAPIAAMGGDNPGSHLFAFAKFSSAGLLMHAVRQAVREAYPDGQRRLFLVPGVRVLQLITAGRDPVRVEALLVSVNGGAPERIDLAEQCNVVLALGTVESTRLALASFPLGLTQEHERIGRNLMTHLRSRTVIRIPREALGLQPGTPEDGVNTAALLVRGRHGSHSFHLEVTAVDDVRGDSDWPLFHQVPDVDLYPLVLEARRPGWVTLVIRGCCEMAPHPHVPTTSDDASWVDRSPYEWDEFDRPVAYVHLQPTREDQAAFDAMVQEVDALVRALANGAEVDVFRATEAEPSGQVSHESGTMWMGADENSSVTDLDGRFWRVGNAYCADQSLFPTIGSAPPVLTGLVLAERVARAVVKDSRPAAFAVNTLETAVA